jgi:hypothetical protein
VSNATTARRLFELVEPIAVVTYLAVGAELVIHGADLRRR